jgi:RNA polymerase sigma factor (TIGR02999 family)
MRPFLADARDVTGLLARLRAGDAMDDDARLRLVYEALRAEARRLVGSREAAPLAPTELAHEVFVKLLAGPNGTAAPWRDRDHFFALASRAMRNFAIDAARRAHVRRCDPDGERGGRIAVGELRVPAAALAALHEGLERLRRVHERCAIGFELHVFAGWEVADVARALGVSRATAYGDITFARAHLQRFLDAPAASG